MRVHLLKSAEMDDLLFLSVIRFLQSVPGPINFCYDDKTVIDYEDLETFLKRIPSLEYYEKILEMRPRIESDHCMTFPMDRETATWETLFGKCRSYRSSHDLPESEFVILLTDIANDKNWFSCLDEKMPYNGFVHTADWEHYIPCSPAFPIAYEVIALVMQKFMFEGVTDLRKTVHNNPIGCVNDMCIQKREVILKLRTGDICAKCMGRLHGRLPVPVIDHALRIMDSLRQKMLFAQNFRQSIPPSRLMIDHKFQLTLADYGDYEVRLRPLEKALFFLYLNHPEGIYMSSLCDHRDELYHYYTSFPGSGVVVEIMERIGDLANALSDSASQKMARIKRVFEEAIGTELASYYYIQGKNGTPKKIKLDRSLVHGPGTDIFFKK